MKDESMLFPAEAIVRQDDLIVTPGLTDRILAIAYLRFEAEGSLPLIFHQGVPTLRHFIEAHMVEGERIVLGCFREIPDSDTPELCGMGWAMDAKDMNGYKRADCGMGFFRRQTRRTDNLKFGRLMLQSFFSRYDIDCLFGITPEPNALALRYTRQLGFDQHGPIPDYVTWQGKPAPGWISHLSKEQWTERGKP